MFAVPLLSSEQKGEALLLFKLLGHKVIHIISDHIILMGTNHVSSSKGKGGWGTWSLVGQPLSSNNYILKIETKFLNLEGWSFQLQVITNWIHSLRRQDGMGSRTHVDEFAFERRKDKSFIVREGRRKWVLVFLSPSTYSVCQLEEQNKGNRCWSLVVTKFGALSLSSRIWLKNKAGHLL